MSWSAEGIERTFLNGKLETLALPAEAVVSAFERVEGMLGAQWIKSKTSATGLAPTMAVVGMGLRLVALEGVDGADKLIKQIVSGERSAEAELTAIYMLRSRAHSIEVQLHPNVGRRKADFRVRHAAEQWTTVEVTQPTDSIEKRRLTKILQRLTGVFSGRKSQFSLEALFNRDPTEEELVLLCEHLPDFCELQGQQQAKLTNELGFLFLNQIPIGHLLKCKIAGLADTPTIGLAMFVGGGPGGGPHHQVFVQIPFTDMRAEEILRQEARQLPQDAPGLIMIDVASTSGAFESWSALFERRFQPSIHTRITGVCLFEGGMVPTEKGYDWLLRTMLVKNPYARFQLPNWIPSAVASAGEEFERVSSTWSTR